jgi:hypothetical protein
MKHQTLEHLQTIAEVHTDGSRRKMTRSERLERWAELLEEKPDRSLGTLAETEYQPALTRDTMRTSGSPITVALEDPILRAEGLTDDTYGEAQRFFELNDWQLHRIVCSCHFGATVRAGRAALCVRKAAERRPGLFAMLWDSILIFR